MLHARNREKAVEVVHGHVGVRFGEVAYRLVIMDGVAHANQLVRPPYIVNHLPIVRWPRVRSEVRVDGLVRTREGEFLRGSALVGV